MISTETSETGVFSVVGNKRTGLGETLLAPFKVTTGDVPTEFVERMAIVAIPAAIGYFFGVRKGYESGKVGDAIPFPNSLVSG